MAFIFPHLRKEWHLTEYDIGLITFTASSCGIAGNLVWGAFADRFGRRPCFMLTVLCVAVFGTLSSFSQSLWSFLLFRTGCSFGIGGNIAVDFTMYTEYL